MTFVGPVSGGGEGTPGPRRATGKPAAGDEGETFDLALLLAMGGFRSDLMLSAEAAFGGAGSAAGSSRDSARGDASGGATLPFEPGSGRDGRGAGASAARPAETAPEGEPGTDGDPAGDVRVRGREKDTREPSAEPASARARTSATQAAQGPTRAEAAEARVAPVAVRAGAVGASGAEGGGRLMLSSAWRILARSTAGPAGATAAKPGSATAESAAARAFELAAKGNRSAASLTVPFDDGAGTEGRIRIAVRGESLLATIVSSNRSALHRLGSQIQDIQRALTERGFTDPQVTVRESREGQDPGRAADRGQPDPDSDPRDAHSGRERRPGHQPGRPQVDFKMEDLQP